MNPQLQSEFCASWNQVVLQAKKLSWSTMRSTDDVNSVISAIRILWKVRQLYIALHQGTDSAPTHFSASTRSGHLILCLSSSYPLCTHPPHHPISIVENGMGFRHRFTCDLVVSARDFDSEREKEGLVFPTSEGFCGRELDG